LSTEEIQINIIHKVGAITETDVMLASVWCNYHWI
jgi:hypothetical protein